MSALDQAFIKAYRQPAEACAPSGVPLSTAIVEDSAASEPVPRAETVLAALATPSGTAPAATPFQPRLYKGPSAEEESPADPAAGDGQRQSVSIGPSRPRPRRMARRDLRRLLQRPPTLATDDLAATIPLYQPGAEPPVESCDDAIPRESEPNRPSAAARGAPPTSPQQPPDDRGSAESTALDPTSRESTAAATNPSEAPDSPVRPPALPRVFRPLLEVDRFVWPDISLRLDTETGGALGRLADTLLQFAGRGRRVLAFGAARRGEGTTTVLSAVAARLAGRQTHIALVDGDLGEPQLARRLGLLPQAGWDDVLAGRGALAEVAIQSTEDGAILLPIREAFGGAGVALGHREIFRDSIRQLAAGAELVLVDLGPLEDRAVVEDFLAGCLAGTLDGVVLVRNVRAGEPERTARIEQAIRAAGIEPLGIVENLAAVS